MAKKWAFITPEGVYKGGRISDQPPSELGEELEGTQEIEVPRFPNPYESWDHTSGSWIEDAELRARKEEEYKLAHAPRKEFAQLMDQRTQEWMKILLPEVIPGLRFTPEQEERLFPLARKK